jgi:hypothetical protein
MCTKNKKCFQEDKEKHHDLTGWKILLFQNSNGTIYEKQISKIDSHTDNES